MDNRIDVLKEEIKQKIAEAADLAELDKLRVGYLGKKGIGINGAAFWLTDYPDSLAGEKLERANARIGRALLRKRIALQAEAVRLLKADNRVLEWNDEFNAKW